MHVVSYRYISLFQFLLSVGPTWLALLVLYFVRWALAAAIQVSGIFWGRFYDALTSSQANLLLCKELILCRGGFLDASLGFLLVSEWVSDSFSKVIKSFNSSVPVPVGQSKFRPNFTISPEFHNFAQISQFRPNFTISPKFHNFAQRSQFCPNFPI